MNHDYNNNTAANPLLQSIKNFFSRLRQNPEVYPIRYYKKSKRFRRNWQAPLVK